MHFELIEETQNGVLYSAMLDEYFVDERDVRSAAEIKSVIDRHKSEHCEESDCEQESDFNSQMDFKGNI
jgi:hypothetical protein